MSQYVNNVTATSLLHFIALQLHTILSTVLSWFIGSATKMQHSSVVHSEKACPYLTSENQHFFSNTWIYPKYETITVNSWMC